MISRWFRSVGRAAALAFARVLAFTAVVTGLATAFALARVLAFTSVLFLHLLVLVLRLNRRAQPREQIGCLDGCSAAC